MLLIWAQNYNASLKLRKTSFKYWYFNMYIKCLINCQDRCSTHGQRYRCDLQKKWNYFGFNQFGNFIFGILEIQYLTYVLLNFKDKDTLWF